MVKFLERFNTTLQGFRDFIMRGNIIDLAVGIVIGAVFANVVTALTTSFITPLVKAATGSQGKVGGQFHLNGQLFDYSIFINALISFLLTAAVLYFLVVLPMNKLAERRRRGEEPPPKSPSEEILLLTQIRDALVAQGRATAPAQRTDADETTPATET